MNAIAKQADGMIRAVSIALFTVFAFCYLYFYQDGVLAVTQHILSKGQTHYDKTMGAIFIALILLAVSILFARLYKGCLRCSALVAFPAALLLGIVAGADISADATLSVGVGSLCAYIILLLLFVAALWAACQSILFDSSGVRGASLLHKLWTNVLVLFLEMALVCTLGNNDRITHAQIHVEQQLMADDADGALHTLQRLNEPTPSLTMLTAYALSARHALPEKLFEMPLSGGSAALLPIGGKARTLLMQPGQLYRHVGKIPAKGFQSERYLPYTLKHGMEKASTADYLLCGYLLDKKLDVFAQSIGKYYAIDSLLPKHYQEALILYTHLRSAPKVVYSNSVRDADFQDYQRMEQAYPDAAIRRNKLRGTYGNTYWYYYQYANN